jgi:hypothetical protein
VIDKNCEKTERKLKVDWNAEHFQFFVSKMYHLIDEPWATHDDLADFIARLDFANCIDCEIWMRSLYGMCFHRDLKSMAVEIHRYFTYGISIMKEEEFEIPWKSEGFDFLFDFLRLAQKPYPPKELFYLKLIYTLLGIQRGVMSLYKRDFYMEAFAQRFFMKFFQALPATIQSDLLTYHSKPPPIALFQNPFAKGIIEYRVEAWHESKRGYKEVYKNIHEIKESDLQTHQIAWSPSYMFVQDNRYIWERRIRESERQKLQQEAKEKDLLSRNSSSLDDLTTSDKNETQSKRKFCDSPVQTAKKRRQLNNSDEESESSEDESRVVWQSMRNFE